MNSPINHSTIKAYLNDELPVQESMMVQNYLAEHLEDQDVQVLLKDWFGNCRTESDKTTENALESTYSRLGIKHSHPKSKVRPVMVVAAMLLAILGSLKIGYSIHKDPSPVAWNEIYVPNSETREMYLPDGTHLTLGAETRVTWPSEFRGQDRSIFVEGEIKAVVAKDPERPFIIHSGDIAVRVYGTTFDFKSYSKDTMVEMMLFEGSVSMDVPSEKSVRTVSLAPGDIVQYNRKDGEVVLERMSVEDMNAFATCRTFSFFNDPLSDITAQLERSFGTRIIVTEPKLSLQRFLAFFPNGESLDEILRLLSVSGNFRVIHKDGVIYLNRK